MVGSLATWSGPYCLPRFIAAPSLDVVALRRIVHHNRKQAWRYLDAAIVSDQSELAELGHEIINAWPRGADHLSDQFLADVGANLLRRGAVAAVTRQDQQRAGEPFLDRVEQQVDLVGFEP